MDLEILVISELDAYSVGDLNISLAYYVLKNRKSLIKAIFNSLDFLSMTQNRPIYRNIY